MDENDPMESFVGLFVFTRVAKVMDFVADTLHPVPIPMLKSWLKSTSAIEMITPQQEAMRLFHIEVITSYIKAREYAQAHVKQ